MDGEKVLRRRIVIRIDPNRYPLDLRDTTPHDGSFDVRLYNPYHTSQSDQYVWVKTRGNLIAVDFSM
jgi:hypothetical protein